MCTLQEERFQTILPQYIVAQTFIVKSTITWTLRGGEDTILASVGEGSFTEELSTL